MKKLRQYIRGLIIEIQQQDFINTYDTAREVHKGYFRRSGEAYFEHPKAVRNLVRKYYPRDYISQLAALLHDTIEDFSKGSSYSNEEDVIERILSGIQDTEVKQQVLTAVQLLTKDHSTPYEKYINRILNNTTALRVKLADMQHNLSTSPSPSQRLKYKTAFDIIIKKSEILDSINPEQINNIGGLLNQKALVKPSSSPKVSNLTK